MGVFLKPNFMFLPPIFVFYPLNIKFGYGTKIKNLPNFAIFSLVVYMLLLQFMFMPFETIYSIML